MAGNLWKIMQVIFYISEGRVPTLPRYISVILVGQTASQT